MAGNVKGIIVEIGGDTSALQKALTNVEKVSSGLTKELNSVTKLLKLDPKNTEMLAQKQELLTQKIDATKNKLQQLKKVKEDYDNTGKDLNTENYRALQREITSTTQLLENLESIGKKAFAEIGDKISGAGEKISDFGNKTSSIGNKITTTLTLPTIAAATAALKYSSDLEQLETSFEVMTGDAEKAHKMIEELKNQGASTPYDLKGLASNVQLLMQYNFTADDAIETTKMLGDISQGSADKMTSITTGYAQMSSAGKVNLQDIKQMINGGFNPLSEISKSTGESMASLYDRISDGKMSIDEITDSIKRATSEGGQFYKSSEKQSETLAGSISTLKDETASLGAELVKGLMPVAKNTVKKGTELIKRFNDMSESEKKNVVQIGLMLAALGPTVKVFGSLITITGKGISAFGTVTSAIGVMKTGIESSNKAANVLASSFKILTNPATLGIATIVTGFSIAIAQIQKAEEVARKSSERIGQAASTYISGISSASSHLDEFNSIVFASNEEQQQIAENMEKIQSDITAICKTASDERRDYTQEEILQLDEYFNKLNELNEKQLAIQQSVSDAISFQAKQEAENFSGSLEEYKIKSQEWINTAQEQKDKTLSMIQTQTTQELALLRMKYGDEANLSSEAYAKEYNDLINRQDERIAIANNEVAKVVEAYSSGYATRSSQEDGFYNKINEYRASMEGLESEHNEKIRQIKAGEVIVFGDKYGAIVNENNKFVGQRNRALKELYKNMSEEQQEELGIWIAQLAQTELYGGKISDENKAIVTSILDSYDVMPEKTRETMKNAMQPMLEEMEKSEPSLFAKAAGIANGILNRLRSTFDIHSPSRKTRKIFNQLMQGGELGIEDEREKILSQISSIGKSVTDSFKKVGDINMKDINDNIVSKTKNDIIVDVSKANSSAQLTPKDLELAFEKALTNMNLKVIVDKEVFAKLSTDVINNKFGEQI